MQFTEKPPLFPARLDKSSRRFCILWFIFIYIINLTVFVPQASAATMGMPGGHVSDPVVRQVDIARPAVVRIITTMSGRLVVHFTPTSAAVTFPLSSGNYPLELSGSGAFISAHGDILTADHVVNPPHDRALNQALYEAAAQDIADYVNAHFQANRPFSAADVVAELEDGIFVATSTYAQPSSEVYLSTAYTGPVNAAKIEDIPAGERAVVDRVEAQSSFDAMDVAIIHVNGMDDMPSIQLGDSSQVEEQDNLTIIGYPGLADVSASPTNLLTSSINKIYVSAMKTTNSGAPVIEVGGNVEHGDSGAPALDDNGNVVGVVSFSVYNPNESGQTSFLQASSSAKTLIQEQGISTTPGPFENAWTRAFNDYASLAPGHWHKAVREFQSLVDSHPGFLGVTDYLMYAQNQESNDQVPATSSGINLVLIVILALLVLLILGIVFLFAIKRNRQPALAGYGVTSLTPIAPPGPYSQQSGVYQPVSTDYSAPVYAQPGLVAESYSSVPAGYAASPWQGQPIGQVPQSPQPVVDQTPLPRPAMPAILMPEHASAISLLPTVQTPLPLEGSEATPPGALASAHEHQHLAWTPPELALSTQSVAQDQSARPVLVSGSLAETWEKSAIYAIPTGQDEVSSSAHGEIVGSELPSNSTQSIITTSDEDERTVHTPFSAAARSFSVPRRPSAPATDGSETAVASSFSRVHTWIAPCGHPNTPDVRFCRICGQLVAAARAQDDTDSGAS